MKIIYVENVRVPSERAHAYQIVQICAWLARLGHEVVLVNPDRANGKDVFEAYRLKPGIFNHVTLKSLDPLAWKWFKAKKIAYFLQRFFFSRALKTWAKDQRADMWYTRDPAMIDILRHSNRVFVLELHDRPDAQLARWERIKSYVRKFVVISNGLKVTLHGLGIDVSRIHVAPDGYDPEDFIIVGDRQAERSKLGVPLDAFVAIYTGGFYAWKGIDLVVSAWSKTDEKAHLILIGGPEGDQRRLESLVDSSVASRVHFFSYMEHANAVRSLVAADVGLLTSSKTHEIGRLYTSPLKQFEYLAAGLPILASDVPSSHEILSDQVAMFYSYSEEGFADSLKKIQNDHAWRTSAAMAAKRKVQPYTWEARARSIAEYLQSV